MDGTANARPNDGARALDDAATTGAGFSDPATRVAQLEQHDLTPKSTGWQVQDWIAIATLIALVIYGSARFGDAAFYARLGTDPNAVGLNYGVTLSRVATTIAVTGAGVVASLLYGKFLKERKESAANKGEKSAADKWPKRAALSVGLLLLGIATAFLIMLILPAALALDGVRVFIAILLVPILFWVGYKFRAPKSGSAKSHIYLAAALATVVLFAVSGVAGYNSAGYVIRGKVLPCSCFSLFKHNITLPWSTGSSGFLGVEANYARVIWVGPRRGMVPTSAVFLGGFNGDVVLFDFIAHRLLIVPSSDIIVRAEGNLIGWNE